MPSRAFGASLRGIDGELVAVEAQIVNGLPGTTVIGLPDSVVRESRDRVKAAIRNSGLPFPDRKTLIHLAPAHTKKEGPALDLAIAAAILAEQGVLPKGALERTLFLGELSLDGSLRSVRGLLALAEAGREQGTCRVIVPEAARQEVSWIEGLEVLAIPNLASAVRVLLGQERAAPLTPASNGFELREDAENDLADVLGQETGKRALLIAAAGSHNLLFHGPPGVGKTMLIRCLPALLPPLSKNEAREVLRIESLRNPISYPWAARRPFRAPHHTISLAGFLGGGTAGRPGEITLAHRGVLFLDEFPEFHRDLLEALRQPLEEGWIEIGRAKYWLRFPADFVLAAAMNPCPCGFLGHPMKPCRCTSHEIRHYRYKLSGPLLDRIDLHVELPPVSDEDRERARQGLTSAEARVLIERARGIQAKRFAGTACFANGRMSAGFIRRYCTLEPDCSRFLQIALRTLSLSQRAHDRCLRVARTIADLAESEEIRKAHLAEALSYRAQAGNG